MMDETSVSQVCRYYICLIPLSLLSTPQNTVFSLVPMSKCRVLDSLTQECKGGPRDVHILLMKLTEIYFGSPCPVSVPRFSFDSPHTSRRRHLTSEASSPTISLRPVCHFTTYNPLFSFPRQYYTPRGSRMRRQQWICAGVQLPRILPFREFRPK